MLNPSDNRIAASAGAIPRLRSLPMAAAADRFFSSPVYFIFLGCLTVISNAFSMELPVYTVLILLGVCVCFFGRDLLPLMPMIVCCYIAPSAANNPGREENSVFYGPGGILLVILLALLTVSIVFRLVADPDIGGKKFLRHKRRLLPGMLALGAAYVLAGAGSGHYFDQGIKNLLFGALQFIAVFLLYYLFSGSVKWDSASRHYLAWTGMCVGFILLAEMANIYLTRPIIENGHINRPLFYTGWGHYNSMGALLTMMIPFPFQLACCRSNKSWLYYLCGVLFFIGVIMTYSRASALFAAVVYLASCLIILFKSRNRRVGIVTNVVTFGTILILACIFREEFCKLFSDLLTNTNSMGMRFDGYLAGIEQFKQHPIFGGTFYPLNIDLPEWAQIEGFLAYVPARWHNTFVQLGASCGIVGLLAYGWHRVQTIRLVFKKPTAEVLCVGASVLALGLTSLLDCHFFNVGPVLFYSMALAFAENVIVPEKAA